MPEVSNLVVTIGADTSGLDRGLSEANQKVSGLGSTIQTALGAAAVGAVAGLGAAFVGSVKSAADFEKQMSAVGAVAGASASEMEQLTSAALQLGKDTSFSASEAAKGIEELVKAGVGIEDVIGGGARAALDLAAAGAVSVGDAAEIASNAMNVFNLKGADMAHVADVIAGAANASAIGVNDYKFSLSAAGAVAATVGLSFEDLSTAIALMGNAGIKGSDAGTSLKTMLLNLQPSTDKQAALFKDLGLTVTNVEQAYQSLVARGITPASQEFTDIAVAMEEHLGLSRDVSTWTAKDRKAWEAYSVQIGLTSSAFFDANGQVKSLAEISDVLREKLGGMTKAQQLATLEALFGADAVRAGAVLLEAGAEGANKMAEALGKVSARSVADERLNNLWGSIEKLKGSLETAAIILGGQFTPALKRMADGATDAVNVVIDALEQIPDAIETVKQVFRGEWMPSDQIRPFTNAVGQAAMAVKQFVDTVKPYFDELVAIVQTALSGDIYGALTDFMTLIRDVTAQLGPVLATWGQAFIDWIAPMIPPFLAAVADIGLQLLTWVAEQIPLILAQLLLWGAAFVDWVEPQIPPLLAALAALGAALAAWLVAQVPVWTAQLLLWGQQFVAWVAPQIPPLLAALGTLGTALLAWLGEQIPPIIAQLVLWGAEFVAWVAPQIGPMLSELGKLILAGLDWIIAQVPGITAKLVEWGILFGAWVITTGIPELLKALPGMYQTLVDWIASAALAIIPRVAELGAALVKGIYDGFVNAWATIGPRIKEAIGSVFTLPSFGGGGATALSYSGGADSESKLQRAYQIALDKGYTPDQANAMLGTLRVEGGLQGALGDSGKSHGPFQLYEGGQFPNFAAWLQKNGIVGDPKELAKDIELATTFALDNYYGAALRQGSALGLSGPALATYAQRNAQVSINPEKAGGAYGPPAGGARTGTPGRMDKMLPEGMRAPLDLMETVNQQFVPQWVRDMGIVSAAGIQTTAEVSTGMDGTGAALVTMSTDAMGNVTRIYSDATGVIGATITDASGAIVNTWGTMATGVTAQSAAMTTGVTEQTNLMASGALTSVTNLGTGILTSVATTSGTTIATVTDMQGQVTSQYATLANGAVLEMGNMAAGIITSTTDLGTGVLTIVQDTSGNYIATVTDLAGNVTAQYTQLGADVVAATVEQSAGVTEQTALMAETVLTSVTDLGDGVLTITQDTSGQMVATITDMAGNVLSTYDSMGQDVVGTATEMTQTVTETVSEMASDSVEEFGKILPAANEATGAMEDIGDVEIPAPDIGDVLDAMEDIEDAAKDAFKALDKVEGGKGKKTGLEKRARGGPVSIGETYLVGEQGPELFSPYSSGHIIPNHALSMSGGEQRLVVDVQIDDRLAERIYIRGRDIDVRRGGWT